jgi:hypothetical protein
MKNEETILKEIYTQAFNEYKVDLPGDNFSRIATKLDRKSFFRFRPDSLNLYTVTILVGIAGLIIFSFINNKITPALVNKNETLKVPKDEIIADSILKQQVIIQSQKADIKQANTQERSSQKVLRSVPFKTGNDTLSASKATKTEISENIQAVQTDLPESIDSTTKQGKVEDTLLLKKVVVLKNEDVVVKKKIINQDEKTKKIKFKRN